LGDPLFWGLPERFAVFHWHDDSFDLPEGAVPLARTDVCPQQAFRFGRCAYGVQFHPEADESTVEAWGGARAVAALNATRELPWAAADHLLLNFLSLAKEARRDPGGAGTRAPRVSSRSGTRTVRR
jgi:GMP synthase-like glutamine amidotransferase